MHNEVQPEVYVGPAEVDLLEEFDPEEQTIAYLGIQVIHHPVDWPNNRESVECRFAG